MPYKPGGYSWLGVSTESKNVPINDKERSRLDHDLETMRTSAISLEKKIELYHTLCKKYEHVAGTERGEKVFYQLQELKQEIQVLSKKISRSLEDSSEITHLPD